MLPAQVLQHQDLLCKQRISSARPSSEEGSLEAAWTLLGRCSEIPPAISIPGYTPSPHTISVAGGDLHAHPSPVCTGSIGKEARAWWGLSHSPYDLGTRAGDSDNLQLLILQPTFRGQAESSTQDIVHNLPKCWQDCYYYHPHYYHTHLFLMKGNPILAEADAIPASLILYNIGWVQNPNVEIHWSLSHNWFKCKQLQGLQTQTQHRYM